MGFVSLFNDISSEMPIILLPLFLSNVLGTSTAIIGVIEGVAESTSTLLKLGAGWLSDRIPQRKPLLLFGYGLSNLSRPFLYFVSAWPLALAIRFLDRVGKGVRVAPRDALLADSTPPAAYGKAFGLHRALDSLGAVSSLAITVAVIYWTQGQAHLLSRHTYQLMVLIGIIPGALAVLTIIFLVREAPRRWAKQGDAPQASLHPRLPRHFYVYLAILVIFTLGNSSDGFLILRAQNRGMSALQIAGMLLLFNVIFAGLARPAGQLADRLGARRVIAVGWLLYAGVYAGFALGPGPAGIVALFAIYGIYYAATEGVGRGLVADIVAGPRRGMAYGLYYLAIGVAALPASIVAGILYQRVGPAAPFALGAALALAAAGTLMVANRWVPAG
jgi:MFS family permease